MAYGKHWEWRAFGGISPRFAKTYLILPIHFSTQTITDEYIWIPGLDVNAKFRQGDEEGLKFKYPEQQEDHFEVWMEDEEHLFEFPLKSEAWSFLRSMFEDTDISLPAYPSTPPDRNTTAELLEEAGCKILSVTKERETRLLEMETGTILVEWTSITEPQPCASVGLETWSASGNKDLASEQSLKAISEAVPKLNLNTEPLRPMNYLEAVTQWVKGNKI